MFRHDLQAGEEVVNSASQRAPSHLSQSSALMKAALAVSQLVAALPAVPQAPAADNAQPTLRMQPQLPVPATSHYDSPRGGAARRASAVGSLPHSEDIKVPPPASAGTQQDGATAPASLAGGIVHGTQTQPQVPGMAAQAQGPGLAASQQDALRGYANMPASAAGSAPRTPPRQQQTPGKAANRRDSPGDGGATTPGGRMQQQTIQEALARASPQAANTLSRWWLAQVHAGQNALGGSSASEQAPVQPTDLAASSRHLAAAGGTASEPASTHKASGMQAHAPTNTQNQRVGSDLCLAILSSFWGQCACCVTCLMVLFG